MKHKKWMIFQILQFLFFLAGCLFFLARTVDGSGAIQTMEAHLVTLAVWGITYLGLLAIEWLAYGLLTLSSRRGKLQP